MSGELFELSSALVLFEYFRVPSRVTARRRPSGLPDGCTWVRSTESGRLLLWLSMPSEHPHLSFSTPSGTA